MKITLSRCFLIVALSVLPIRMSFSEPGRAFWRAFGYEWLWFFWSIGFASTPDKTIYEVTTRTFRFPDGVSSFQQRIAAAEFGYNFGIFTNIVAIVMLMWGIRLAWKATAVKRSEGQP